MRQLSPAVLRFSGCLVLGLWLAVALAAQQDSGPLRLTLEDALQRAQKNSITYQAAITDVMAEHRRDGFAAGWLRRKGLDWAADLVSDAAVRRQEADQQTLEITS